MWLMRGQLLWHASPFCVWHVGGALYDACTNFALVSASCMLHQHLA